MRKLPLSLLAVLLGLAACATLPGPAPTHEAPLADAKLRSSSYCSKTPAGCEYVTTRTKDGGWGIRVVPVLRGSDGARVYDIDLDDFYIYNSHGQFVSALRGY